jgi:hypothetical protein
MRTSVAIVLAPRRAALYFAAQDVFVIAVTLGALLP